MRVRLNSNKPNSQQKKALREQCRIEFFNLLEHYNRQVSLQIMYILHFSFGFGKKRLMRFFTQLKEMQAQHIERYEVTDDDVPDICEIKLRERGISFNDFFEVEDEKRDVY